MLNQNLVKTAQLNIHELLHYLNHRQITNEMKELKHNQKKCMAHQLNVRLKQNWITGPIKTQGQASSRRVSEHSIHNVKASQESRAKGIINTGSAPVRASGLGLSKRLAEASVASKQGSASVRFKEESIDVVRESKLSNEPKELKSNQLALGSVELGETMQLNPNDFSAICQLEIDRQTYVDPADRGRLLVTRKRRRERQGVPLSPLLYPFDVQKTKSSARAVRTQQARKRWQSVVHRDIVVPNLHKVDPFFHPSILVEGTPEQAVDVRQTPARRGGVGTFISLQDRQAGVLKAKYDRFAKEYQQDLQTRIDQLKTLTWHGRRVLAPEDLPAVSVAKVIQAATNGQKPRVL